MSYSSRSGSGYKNQRRSSKSLSGRAKSERSAEAFRQWVYKQNPEARKLADPEVRRTKEMLGHFKGVHRPVSDIEAERSSILQMLHAKEQDVYSGKMSREDYENYRDYVLKEGMPKRVDLSPFVYRTSIGHYGGLFIEVPVEVFSEFKDLWPSSEFPRRVVDKDVVEMNGVYGLNQFRRIFPNFSGKVKQVFFSNGSTGEKRIDIAMNLPHERETNPGD